MRREARRGTGRAGTRGLPRGARPIARDGVWTRAGSYPANERSAGDRERRVGEEEATRVGVGVVQGQVDDVVLHEEMRLSVVFQIVEHDLILSSTRA